MVTKTKRTKRAREKKYLGNCFAHAHTHTHILRVQFLNPEDLFSLLLFFIAVNFAPQRFANDILENGHCKIVKSKTPLKKFVYEAEESLMGKSNKTLNLTKLLCEALLVLQGIIFYIIKITFRYLSEYTLRTYA